MKDVYVYRTFTEDFYRCFNRRWHANHAITEVADETNIFLHFHMNVVKFKRMMNGCYSIIFNFPLTMRCF